MANGTVSIKEISRLSGVSVATVSRVINQNGRFSKETEERVKRIIAENHYTPDVIARGLRTNKVQTIGMILPDITNEFYAQITRNLQIRLFEMGYSAMICNTNEVPEVASKHIAMLRSHKVAGLIYLSGADAAEEAACGIPAVYIERMPPGTDSTSVCIESDYRGGGALAAGELISKGCTKIAVLAFAEENPSQTNCLSGYKDVLRDRFPEKGNPRFFTAPRADIRSGYQTVRRMLEDGIDFDGLLCTGDYLAIGAVKALGERGVAIPSEVKVAGFDDVFAAEICTVPLTTVRRPINRLAMLGANSLVYIIEGGAVQKKTYTLPVDLVIREST